MEVAAAVYYEGGPPEGASSNAFERLTRGGGGSPQQGLIWDLGRDLGPRVRAKRAGGNRDFTFGNRAKLAREGHGPTIAHGKQRSRLGSLSTAQHQHRIRPAQNPALARQHRILRWR